MATLFAAGACESLKGPVAPESADVRQAPEPVDTRAGRRGRVAPRPDTAPGQRRNHAAGPAPLARDLEAGQTLDTGPDPAYARKKNGATSSSSGR